MVRDDGRYVDGSVWFFDPNKIAPIVLAAIFGASGLVHAWQCYQYKCWKLTGWAVAGALVYAASLVARVMGAGDYKNLTIYVVHFNLVYAAPPLFEMVNYCILARVTYYLPYHSPIHPGRLKTTLTSLATIIEILGGYGAYYTSKRDEPRTEQNIGRGVLAASLFMQIIVIAAYLALAALFHVRSRRSRGPRTRSGTSPVLWTLYVSSVLIFARTVFRLVEFFGFDSFRPFDNDGNAITIADPSSVPAVVRFEWPFYAFDAGVLLLNLLILHVSHPRRYLPQGRSVYLAQDGVTELEGPGFKDDRNICVIIMDPLDFIGMIKGTNKATRFWEMNGFSERSSAEIRGEHALGDEPTRVRHEGRRKR
ncbi:RTA1 domain-containing protein [Colletotrichum musicola]|uniref:RTA1 domain-containing protein n=1 Tax=Colletotrichum musicola TaxID=2175873 RepID=A0A8H6KII3_9PEZI|nr:RTA1 domain-containing protein [Colletotrichum musicola]